MKMAIISLFLISTLSCYSQETKVTNLCYMGYNKVRSSLERAEGEYYLHIQFIREEGFYVNKGAEFIIITVTNDTLKFIGMNEGQSFSLAGTQQQPPGRITWGFNNKYHLQKDQIQVLKSTELKMVMFNVDGENDKMEIPSFSQDLIINQFRKLEK